MCLQSMRMNIQKMPQLHLEVSVILDPKLFVQEVIYKVWILLCTL